MGSYTYIIECLRKIRALLKVSNLRKEKLPCSTGGHHELDSSPLLDGSQNCLYQQIVGMAEWAVHIGIFDICYAVTPLNRFYAAPREGHLKRLVNIFGYLQTVPAKRKSIFVSPEDIGDISGKGANTKYWLEKYPTATE